MKYKFTIDDFLESLKFGHEIEFTFDENLFFIQPDYEFNKENQSKKLECDRKYVLYQCANWYDNNAKILLSGSFDEITSFPLKDKMTIKTDFDKFQLHCIL